MSRIALSSLEGRWNDITHARVQFFRYRTRADVSQKIGLALGFSAITGLAAQIQLVLPFTPIPITFTTFAVLLSGIALGARWGGISQTLYIGLGAAGLPWFAGTSGGFGVILGATGGYIIGFVLAAVVVGFYTDKLAPEHQLYHLIIILIVANFVVIYGTGLPWFFGWLTISQGSMPSMVDLLSMGLFPFIPGDVIKLFFVVPVAKVIIPNEAY